MPGVTVKRLGQIADRRAGAQPIAVLRGTDGIVVHHNIYNQLHPACSGQSGRYRYPHFTRLGEIMLLPGAAFAGRHALGEVAWTIAAAGGPAGRIERTAREHAAAHGLVH
jgi:hypothetical protein